MPIDKVQVFGAIQWYYQLAFIVQIQKGWCITVGYFFVFLVSCKNGSIRFNDSFVIYISFLTGLQARHNWSHDVIVKEHGVKKVPKKGPNLVGIWTDLNLMQIPSELAMLHSLLQQNPFKNEKATQKKGICTIAIWNRKRGVQILCVCVCVFFLATCMLDVCSHPWRLRCMQCQGMSFPWKRSSRYQQVLMVVGLFPVFLKVSLGRSFDEYRYSPYSLPWFTCKVQRLRLCLWILNKNFG